MGYIENLLSKDETIGYRNRKHVFALFGQLVREISVLTLSTSCFLLVRYRYPGQYPLLQLTISLIALVAMISLLIDYLRWKNEEYLVTNRRVIHSSGVLNKKILDSSLSKINDVFMEQSFLGRIFGYGTIKIMTATEEVINLLDGISRPIEFKKAMLKAKAEMEPMTSADTSLRPSLTMLLEDLAVVREREMISEEEYQEKRKEILKRF